MIILRNTKLINCDFIEEINTFQTIISEKQNNFEMNLHLSFPQKGKLYKLGKHYPDNHGMNTLFSQTFCDGIIRFPVKPRFNPYKNRCSTFKILE